MPASEKEREMLRERERSSLGERRPWESSRQATYEDSVPRDEDEGDDETMSSGRGSEAGALFPASADR